MKIRNGDDKATLYIGVDEAGRGPLIGDMVVAGVLSDGNKLKDLEMQGLVESKQLNAETRSTFYKKAIKHGVVVVAVYVPPWRIDNENLNKLEEEQIKWILKVFSKIIPGLGVDEVKVFIDEVKGSAQKIESAARELFSKYRLVFQMEPEADAKYSPVALASIFAKVMRDRNLDVLKKLHGDFGSGYSADPLTISWVKMNYKSSIKPPLFIRRSWRNLRNLAPEWYIEKKAENRKHRSLFDFTKR
jgi:ribonuclease H, mammalian HI/archaeal HII subfamily